MIIGQLAESPTPRNFSMIQIIEIGAIAAFGIWCGTLQATVSKLDKAVDKILEDQSLKASVEATKTELGKAADAQIERLNSVPFPSYKQLEALPHTWLRGGERQSLFSDQVIILAADVYDREATFVIDISVDTKVTFERMEYRERRTFTYLNQTYILECPGFKRTEGPYRGYGKDVDVNFKVYK